MDGCRIVGPRGLCRPLDEKQGFPTNNLALAPCQKTAGQGRAGEAGQGRAGQGRAGQGRGQGRAEV